MYYIIAYILLNQFICHCYVISEIGNMWMREPAGYTIGKVGKYKVRDHDLHKLKENNWLNDVVSEINLFKCSSEHQLH